MRHPMYPNLYHPEMSGPNMHLNPYHPQGYYPRPQVMAPPFHYAPPPPPPPRKEPGFLEGCLMALRCCCLAGEYCGDPSGVGF